MPKGAETSPSDRAGGPSPAVSIGKNYAHTLSLRLTAEQYRRLRHYVRRMEDEGRGRVTHQSLIETALGQFLEREG